MSRALGDADVHARHARAGAAAAGDAHGGVGGGARRHGGGGGAQRGDGAQAQRPPACHALRLWCAGDDPAHAAAPTPPSPPPPAAAQYTLFTELTALLMEQQRAPLHWAACPASPLELLKGAQLGMGLLTLAALLKQQLTVAAVGSWAEACSRNFAEGRPIFLHVSGTD